MRILIITDKAERHYHFVNQIIEGTGSSVVGLVTGAKKVRRTRGESWGRLYRRGEICVTLKNIFLNKLYRKWGQRFKKEKEAAEEAGEE